MSDQDEQESQKVSIADARRKLSPREAREAAAEAGGFLASETITLKGNDYEIPQRGLLDDDQREAMDQLEFESQSWDREDDVEITRADGSTYTLRGNLKLPYQKNGKRIQPNYATRVAIAILGKDGWEQYKKDGGSSVDITATLARLDNVVKERVQRDPKSVGGSD